MELGMGPDSLLPGRKRTLSRCSLPISAGMEPSRLVFVRFSRERKERLSRCGVRAPWRGPFGNDRAVTRCRRQLHETPTHRHKDTLVAQQLARIPSGSESSRLKANSAARSMLLPLTLAALLLELIGDGEETASAAGNRPGIIRKMAKGARATG